MSTLAKAARSCSACHLYKRATQTVFGEGPKGVAFMLLGEQPGDQEDLARKPFLEHPSSLLRQPDEESREREYAHFVADLRAAQGIGGQVAPAAGLPPRGYDQVV